eukprot:2519857-Prymnesium_polylepis.1
MDMSQILTHCAVLEPPKDSHHELSIAQGCGHRSQGCGHRSQGCGHRSQGCGHRSLNVKDANPTATVRVPAAYRASAQRRGSRSGSPSRSHAA